MAKDLNDCKFIGRLGREVEIKYLTSGNAVANFSIACSDDYKDKNSGQIVKQTNWIRIIAFGKLAEICGQYLTKGSQVFISGKQQTRKWQGQDGQDRYTTEVVASEMQMLGGKNADGGGQGGGQYHGQPAQQAQHAAQQQGHNAPQQGGNQGFEDFDDDIPF